MAGMVENQRLLLSFENNVVLCTSKTCRVELFLSYVVSQEFELGAKVKPVPINYIWPESNGVMNGTAAGSERKSLFDPSNILLFSPLGH